MMKDPIIYEIMVSRKFPATHPRKGDLTGFREKILLGLNCPDCRIKLIPSVCRESTHTKCIRKITWCSPKIHTIRQNYPIWEKRMKKIQSGEAFLLICEWALPGGRWNKKNTKIEICQLGKDDGIGIQKLKFEYAGLSDICYAYIGESRDTGKNIPTIASNDGLAPNDFKAWFHGPERPEPLVIIHFTKFRY